MNVTCTITLAEFKVIQGNGYTPVRCGSRFGIEWQRGDRLAIAKLLHDMADAIEAAPEDELYPPYQDMHVGNTR